MNGIKELFGKIAQAGANLGSTATEAAPDRATATYLNIAAVYGTLASLAVCVGQCPQDKDATREDWNPSARITRDVLLFAALLVVETNTPVGSPSKRGNMSASNHETNFCPETVAAALDSFERLTGRKPDSQLNAGMIADARNGATAADVMLADFLSTARH